MWLRVILWISIGLCWGAIALNIVTFVRTNRTHKRLVSALEKARELVGMLLIEKARLKMTENLENKEGDTNDENT